MVKDGIPRNADGFIDWYGTWCPNCHNRCSKKHKPSAGNLTFLVILAVVGCIAIMAIPLALIVILVGAVIGFLLPSEWKCYQCQNKWKA